MTSTIRMTSSLSYLVARPPTCAKARQPVLRASLPLIACITPRPSADLVERPSRMMFVSASFRLDRRWLTVGAPLDATSLADPAREFSLQVPRLDFQTADFQQRRQLLGGGIGRTIVEAAS